MEPRGVSHGQVGRGIQSRPAAAAEQQQAGRQGGVLPLQSPRLLGLPGHQDRRHQEHQRAGCPGDASGETQQNNVVPDAVESGVDGYPNEHCGRHRGQRGQFVGPPYFVLELFHLG